LFFRFMREITLRCTSLDDDQRPGSHCNLSGFFPSLTLSSAINKDKEQVQWER
jgi:hypothetical protein